MAGAAYNQAAQINIRFISATANQFAFKLWKGEPADADWVYLDEGDNTSAPKQYGPFPQGTKIDYYLLIGGDPSRSAWTVELELTQAGQVLSCAPGADHGNLNDKGVDEYESQVTLQ